MIQFILYSIGVFLTIILLLVVILLIAKKYLSPSGNVNIEINGDKTISVAQGSSLMTTLNENGIFLPSACGGKASCGQCKVQVLDGGGEILDSEKPHFTRKEIKDNWRLGCQCKVEADMKIKVPESVMGVKEWECTVISNKNVSSFIKEFIVALPPGEHMDFIPGSYAQIKIPAYDCIDYDKDFDKNDIGADYLPSWENFNIFSLKAHNPEDTIRAYNLDTEKMATEYIPQFKLDAEKSEALKGWYESLIQMMREEGVTEHGHLQINKNILILLNDLHTQLLKSSKHPFYSAAYYKALPFIVELRAKSAESQEKGEIENCFDALYGTMLLRAQKKDISAETATAMNNIAKFIGLLSDYYLKDKAGELKIEN